MKTLTLQNLINLEAELREKFPDHTPYVSQGQIGTETAVNVTLFCFREGYNHASGIRLEVIKIAHKHNVGFSTSQLTEVGKGVLSFLNLELTGIVV